VDHHDPMQAAGGNVSEIDKTALRWRKSTKSAQDNCVEMARVRDGVLVRDSKDPEGGWLAIDDAAWQSFIAFLR
jgi:hypothetical protein